MITFWIALYFVVGFACAVGYERKADCPDGSGDVFWFLLWPLGLIFVVIGTAIGATADWLDDISDARAFKRRHPRSRD